MPQHRFPDASPFNAEKAPRQWLPNPDELVDACAASIAEGPRPQILELAQQLAAPTLDLTITALTARATLMAATHGRAFYHHELRRRVAMPPALEPEISVWEAGTVPVWSDGVLAEPKYFSFFQDAPFPAYNPNHRRKWRAHELLHGASRFFWCPRMTRFEFYVSARLNELLPVVHWYHLDEIFRPRCEEHHDTVLHRAYCPRCHDAAVHYWESSAPEEPGRVEAAEQLVDDAWGHFEEEWRAIGTEIATGRQTPTPRPRLDASSDAVGYMRAHWNRVTAWSFGRWMELFMVEGVDYFSTLPRLRDNVGRSLHRLVSGTLEVDLEHYQARRTRSQLQDLGYRVLLALEWLDPDSEGARRAEEVLMPQLEESARLATELLDDPSKSEAGLQQFAQTCQAFSRVAPRFPDDVADGFLGFGYRFIDRHVFADAALGQVFHGLEDGLPETTQQLTEPIETIRGFVASDEFDEHGRLSGRFASWLEMQGEHPRRLKEVARFEAFANAEPRTDEEAKRFAALPERAGAMRERPGRLRPHATLRRGTFSADVLAELTGADFAPAGDIAIAASLIDGDLRLVIEDEFSTAVLDRVSAGEPIDEWWDFALAEAIMDLLEHSLITWLPRPSE